MSNHPSKHPYVSPKQFKDAFNCVFCSVYARQDWYYVYGTEFEAGHGGTFRNADFVFCVCAHCHHSAFWLDEVMIFPINSGMDGPAADMPANVKGDFEEAHRIAGLSPRGAAALLRLALQKLCVHLGQQGKNINEDIKALVEKGLPAPVQQALDSVRVIGNEAVHPGTLDLKDDIDTVAKLFKLVNFIVEKMITEPNEVKALYSGLPPDKLEGIAARDAKKKP